MLNGLSSFVLVWLGVISNSQLSLAQELRVEVKPVLINDLLDPEHVWGASEPVLEVREERLPVSPGNPWFAVKDPSIVRYGGEWHLFCTLRKRMGGDGKPPGYIRIGYVHFAEWEQAYEAEWSLIDVGSLGYHGAPQVFYFRPHKKWYLVYQCESETRAFPFGPCYSTTEDITDPTSWTQARPFYPVKPKTAEGWLDFWVICDETHAYLFYTSLDGRMWRARTVIDEFPQGFSDPEVCLKADIFEASHTYLVERTSQYVTIVEAQGKSGPRGRRYYKAYLADALDGEWRPLAATAGKPFAGGANVAFPESGWTDSISHGELIRAGYDERLMVSPDDPVMLFQGVKDERWRAGYGGLNWKLGLLRLRDE